MEQDGNVRCPVGSARSIEFIFEDISKPGTIQVPVLLDKLSRLQEAIWATGAYLMKESPKETGRYSKSIHEHFTITMTGLKPGSTGVCLQIVSPYGPLFEEDQSIGEKAIDTIETAIEIVEKEENPLQKMSELVHEDIYRRRISRALYNVYPTEGQSGIRIRFDSEREKILSTQHRSRFEELMKIPEAGEIATINGPIVKWDLLKGTISIWTSRGKIKCGFSSEMGPEIIRYGGQIVEITGSGLFNREGMPREIRDISNIIPKSEMSLETITSGSIEYNLTKSLPIIIEFDVVNKSWTIKNDDLGIVSVGKDWDHALTDFQSEFVYLVEHYRSSDDSTLSRGSIERKKNILSLVGER